MGENASTRISNNLISKKQSAKLGISAMVLAIMVFLRDLGVYHFSPMMFLIVVGLICIILPYKSLTAFFFYYIPFCFSIHGMVLVPILLALLLKNNKANSWQFVFTIAILIIELLHFISYLFQVEFVKYLIFAPYIFLFFIILFDDNQDDASINLSIKYFIIGTSFILFTIVVHSIALYGVDGVLLGAMRIGGDDTGFDLVGPIDITIMNANTLAYFSVSAFSLLLFSNKDNFSVFGKIVLLLILLCAGILSTSRTWLFTMAFVFVVYFLFGEMKRRIGGLVFVVVLFVFSIKYNTLTESFTERFQERLENEENMKKAGGRTTLFKAYNDFMLDHPNRIIYGTGTVYYKQVCQVYNSIHSGLQQIYVCYGLLGIAIYVMAGIVFYKRYIKHKKTRFWDYVPFLACFVFDQSIQFLSPHALMFPFLAVLLPLKLKMNEAVEIINHH